MKKFNLFLAIAILFILSNNTVLSRISEWNKNDIHSNEIKRSNNPSLVSNIAPTMNALNVYKSSNIAIVFSQDMNSSTIISSRIKVFGNQTGLVSASVSYNAVNKTATINPNSDYKFGEKIQVVLSSGILTSSNTPITPFTWTFTVQAIGGTGIFTESPLNLEYMDQVFDIVPGDFDGDGDLDVTVINFRFGPNLNFFANTGNGNFSFAPIASSISDISIATLTADYDNDGDLDIAMTKQNGEILIYKNNSSGSFSFGSSIQGYGSVHFKQGDFDSDGDIDLVTFRDEGSIGIGLGVIFILFNNGTGEFSFRSQQYTSCGCPIESGHASLELLVSDYDNDGDLDLLIEGQQFERIIPPSFNCECSYLSILTNVGNATFNGGMEISAPNLFGNAVSDDIDGNGFNDIVTNSNVIFKNDSLVFTQSNYSGSGGALLTGDVDGDGDLDLSERRPGNSQINFYGNNGSGAFTFLSGNSTSKSPDKFASGDFDNDGDIDVIYTNQNNSFVSILFNDYDCPPLNAVLSGNFAIPVNSAGNIYTSSTSQGFWDIANYDSCQASIPPNSTGSSVQVTSGTKVGHFVLYFIANNFCGDTVLFSKHGYVENPAAPLNLSMAAVPEGFLNSSSNSSNMRDTLSIYLRNISAPYSIVDSARSVLDSVSLTLQLNFPNAQSGYYYVIVRHRNSLETWSKLGGKLFVKGITSYYDFTSSKFQAYGNNLILKGSLYCLIGGDVNQDGVVDGTDGGLTDNDVFNFASGYIKTDVTGDQITDATDYALVDNNILNFETAKSPLLGDIYLRGESRTSNLREHFYGNTGS
ncbi:MAG: FG-GAP-like repeat-containing protein, partial [Ignavibacteria bacterium]